MRLRYSSLSPFARKVRVFAAETGLDDALDLVPCDVWSAETDIDRDNPLGKVPVIVSEGGVFAGSGLCCEYLDSLHAGTPLIPRTGPDRWRILQLDALADGLMEAAVAHVTERLRRPPEFVYAGWMQRQCGKIDATLDFVESRYGAPGATVDISAITLACALSYLDIRLPQLEWRRNRKTLAGWHADFRQRRSMTATEPPPAEDCG